MRAPRGQNMVLLALTMLLVTLMVTMTIGVGLRIRQKQELQNLADAAAFSNAVATARVFNSAALTNRAEVSYWVAQAADESLISWTGYARAMTFAAVEAAQNAKSNCTSADGGTTADFDGFIDDVNSYRGSTLKWSPGWTNADRLAGAEAKSIQGQIGALRSYIQRSISDLDGVLDCGGVKSVTRRVIVASGMQSTVTCEPLGVQVTRKEVFSSSVGYEGSANTGLKASPDGEWNRVMREAAMGTRGGAPFLTMRGVVPSAVAGALASFASNNGISFSSSAPIGSAYWADQKNHGSANHSGYRVWADDHDGAVTVSGGGCSATRGGISGYVMSSAEQFVDDLHDWSPNNGPEDIDPPETHTMGPYSDPDYPGVWVPTPSFLAGPQADAWGQPKLLVALRRDLSGARFPWELEFDLGNGARWDGRLANRRQQAAYATAMVYYHHHGQGGVSGWQEFPNLLNPFWRATLVAADIDGSPKQVSTALPGTPWNALLDNGYKGIH